jgi:acid phosphatase (class A)
MTSLAGILFLLLVQTAGSGVPALAEEKPAKATTFVVPAELDLTRLLPPPPEADSAETKAELSAVRRIQEASSAERRKVAEEDTIETVFAVVRNDLGPTFTADRLPVASAFFKRLLADEGAVVDPAKAAWARPRPFMVDPAIKACPPAKTTGAYPSGHATVGYLTAIVLSDMVPERRAIIFASAGRYAESRLVCGVHYPSDIAASRTAAAVIAVQVRANAAFRQEFADARAEVRKAMGIGS